jgi:D-alanyl-D-alanine carboxypeptidase
MIFILNGRNFLMFQIITGFILVCSSTEMNIANQNRNNRIQDHLEKLIIDNKTPGIQYVVVNSEGILFSGSAGYSDLKNQKRIGSETTMMAYSMTKTFTAVAVLQLAEQGRIDLDAPLSVYLPDLPYGNEIRVRHLLSQTSGIPNPIPLKWVHLMSEHEEYNPSAELSKILEKYSDLDFQPGKKYAYSNISYWLLGDLIATVSGKPYETFMSENIFKKLGMKPFDAGFIIPSLDNHAKGYLKEWSMIDIFKSFLVESKYFAEYETGWLAIQPHYLNGSAFGGLVCSAETISVFLRDQLREDSRILSSASRNLFYSHQYDNNRKAVEMTLGWHIGKFGNDSSNSVFYYKEGGGAGFHSEMRVYKSLNLATVVIANNTSFDVKDFLNQEDKAFFPK